jgi:tetraacyldisaccharide 4'-kinase
MSLQLGRARPVAGGPPQPLQAFAGRPLHALAGIADPARFFDALRAAGLEVAGHPFADHHPFTEADFGFDDGRPLLMTEKDAVKCRRFARSHWFAVAVDAVLPAAFFDALAAALAPHHPTREVTR